jgi:acetolactate synthase-1/2/3 large subunit
MTKLSDYVLSFVAGQGVRHVFLLPGGGCMHLIDSVGQCPDVEYVACLHEQTCAYAAEAYSEYANGLGVAIVTTGPGGTNALTGVACAWYESGACLVISGQVKRADMIGDRHIRTVGQQELNVVPVVRPITKYAVTVTDPSSIRYHLEKAVFLATHGRRGPVWVDIPLDVQAAMIDEKNLKRFDPAELGPPKDGAELKSAVARAIDVWNAADRPVLMVGNGVRLAGASQDFLTLAERLGAPVLLTWKALDLMGEDHPLYAGRPGAAGQRGANFTQQNSDCLLIVGARLDLLQTAFNHANFARAAKKIMVDVDGEEIRKMQTEIHVPIVADAGEFLGEFLRQAGRLQRKDRSAWLARAKDWQCRYPVVMPEWHRKTSGPVNPYMLMDVLADACTPEDLLVPGSSGTASDILMQTFRVKPGQRVMNAPGWGAMGTGIPATIGACLASGRRRTICPNGDGGFQLNIQDLETIRRLALPIKYFVLDNGGYASIRAMQRSHFQGRYVASGADSGLTLPDMRKIVRAYGIACEEIDDAGELEAKVRKVLATEGPIVCVVRVDGEQPTMPRCSSSLRSDGTIVSKPMEDMWPFLDRQEFRQNMLIPPLEE